MSTPDPSEEAIAREAAEACLHAQYDPVVAQMHQKQFVPNPAEVDRIATIVLCAAQRIADRRGKEAYDKAIEICLSTTTRSGCYGDAFTAASNIRAHAAALRANQEPNQSSEPNPKLK